MGYFRVLYIVDIPPNNSNPEGLFNRYLNMAFDTDDIDSEIEVGRSQLLEGAFDNVRHFKTIELTKEEYDGLVK